MSFFAKCILLKSTVQFGIRKNVICEQKSMFTSRRCVCFFSSRRTCRWPELQHKSLILAKFLSRKRALSFPFIAFLYSILYILQFGLKKNHMKYDYDKYVYEAPKNWDTVRWATAWKLTTSLIIGSAVKFVIWGL